MKPWSNVRLIFLPPNLTSIAQPLDQGIIRNVKAIFRKQLISYLIAKADEELETDDTSRSATKICKDVNVYDAIRWITLAWHEVKQNTIRKCFRRSGISEDIDSDALLEPESEETVNVFEGIETLNAEVRDELAFVTEEEFVNFDNNIQVEESSGDTTDEIADQVLQEVLDSAQQGSSGTPNVVDPAGDEQSDDDEEDETTEVQEQRFPIKDEKDVEDALSSLEAYCFATDSSNLPLLNLLRKGFAAERLQAKLAALKRMQQPTLDNFLIK